MSSSAVSALDVTRPYRVPEHIGAVHLIVMNSTDQIVPAVHAQISASPTRKGLRITGGCANMEAPDKVDMLAWFSGNLVDFSGFVSSGATREVSADRLLDPMVTEVPALLASTGRVTTLSTVPRVGAFQLVDESRLQMFREDEWGGGITCPNPGVHMIVVVQDQMGDQLDWDGDLLAYVELFDTYRRTAGWDFATIVWNGGGVTKTEVKLTARAGWPVILVKGSGRAADEYCNAIKAGDSIDFTLTGEDEPVLYDPSVHQLYVVSKDEPTSLRDQLAALGFMQ